MPMSRVAALLERATLHVGLDSGVLHLAMALGKPTVSLFRESAGRPGWVPRGAKHRALIKKCPCNETGQNKCFESRPLCLSLIRPREVAQAVLAALGEKL
jgi:ADP-heptose:LPS heptosyltransferase